jgi:uncharacterized protein YkwD
MTTRAGQTAGDPGSPQPSKEATLILEMINAERMKVKSQPYQLNPLLTRAAQGHSVNMAKQRQLTHKLEDKSVGARVRAAGYSYTAVAENITRGFPPKQVVGVWMNSKGHRGNLLATRYTDIGIGIAEDAAGMRYYTAVFATPRKR